jgi:hypothetical protein
MSVDLRGTYVGVAEQLLDRSQIGAALEEVRRVRVPKRVRMERSAIGERIAGEDSPRVPGRQATAPGVDEERGRGLLQELGSGGPKIRGNRVASRAAQREPPDLRAFAEHRDRGPAQVDGLDVETATFAHPETRAVEKLEERGVAQHSWIIGVTGGHAVEHRNRVVATRDARQLLRTPGGVKSCRDVA